MHAVPPGVARTSCLFKQCFVSAPFAADANVKGHVHFIVALSQGVLGLWRRSIEGEPSPIREREG